MRVYVCVSAPSTVRRVMWEKSERRLSVDLTKAKSAPGQKIVSRHSFSSLLMNEQVIQGLVEAAESNGIIGLMIFMSDYS